MERNSDSDCELLENIARVHLFYYHRNTEKPISSDDTMDNEHTETQWSVPTRDARDLIVAEEIIRFASITDRPITSRSAQESKVLPGVYVFGNNASTSTGTTERLATATAETEVTFPSRSGNQKSVHTASLAGTSGSDPQQSAARNVVEPSTSKSQDDCISVGAAVPIDNLQNLPPHRSPMFRTNTLPVTNRILAALARSKEEERSTSNSPETLLPKRSIDEYRASKNEEMLGRYLEHLKRMQDSDVSRSSSRQAQATPRPSRSSSKRFVDEKNKIKNEFAQATQLEEIVTKNMQVIVARLLKSKCELKTLRKLLKNKLEVLVQENGEMDEDEAGQQANGHDKTTSDNDDDTYEEDPEQGCQPCTDDDIYILYTDSTTPTFSEHPSETVEMYEQNDEQQIDDDDNNPNDTNAEGSQVTDEDTGPSEFPELNDESISLEWSRQEKRRLSRALRDLSREIKTNELNRKKARLVTKSRVIQQAVESSIFAIDKKIMAVNQSSLKELALPLDQIQEYDWDRVANVLKAKRTPQECSVYWHLLLHPSINSSDWTETEINNLETIAQRHNFRNWNAIAAELNTGRNGFLCYLLYRHHLCPQEELREECSNN